MACRKKCSGFAGARNLFDQVAIQPPGYTSEGAANEQVTATNNEWIPIASYFNS
jgi:hypothetical protein